MNLSDEQCQKLKKAENVIGYHFDQKILLLNAITHPSAATGDLISYSYERLEFLGDAILGAIVSSAAFDSFPDIDEGGLTRIKVALVSGPSLSHVAENLGFTDFILFGSSEVGTGGRGLHSALENVYESIVGALYLDGGLQAATEFVNRTLIPRMTYEMACEPENPKSALQEKLQEDGITPTYKLVDTQGPPHDRTFVAQVYAGDQGLAQGTGRTKKEAESQAAKSTLARLGEFLGIGLDDTLRAERDERQRLAKEKKAEARAMKEEQSRKAKADKEKANQKLKASKEQASRQAKAAKLADRRAKKTERNSSKKK